MNLIIILLTRKISEQKSNMFILRIMLEILAILLQRLWIIFLKMK